MGLVFFLILITSLAHSSIIDKNRARNRIEFALQIGYTDEGYIDGIHSVLHWSEKYSKESLREVFQEYEQYIEKIEWLDEMLEEYEKRVQERLKGYEKMEKKCEENAKYQKEYNERNDDKKWFFEPKEEKEEFKLPFPDIVQECKCQHSLPPMRFDHNIKSCHRLVLNLFENKLLNEEKINGKQ